VSVPDTTQDIIMARLDRAFPYLVRSGDRAKNAFAGLVALEPALPRTFAEWRRVSEAREEAERLLRA
jgi:hypothetical protein